ncbi:MAG: helix-turn-helix transcriptional regulator [Pseudomonadota bacterium]
MAKTIRSAGHLALVGALVEARLARGLTQSELAERLGCHQSFVARIETEQRRIDVSELVILCRALEADPVVILRKVMKATPQGERI